MRLRKTICLFIIFAILVPGLRFGAGQKGPEELILNCAMERFYNTNPLRDDAASWKVLGLIYDSATRHNPYTGAMVPYIAVGSANLSHDLAAISWADCTVGNFGYSPSETWENASKPEIVIFYDFENVLWHDGVQMNIGDILFSFHAHATSQFSWLGHPLKDLGGKGASNYSTTQWLSVSKEWESADGRRAALRFVLQEPFFSVFEHYLSSPVLPYHIWGGRASGQWVDWAKIWFHSNYSSANVSSWQPSIARAWSNPKPVGSSPFIWETIGEGALKLSVWGGHFYRPGYRYETSAAPARLPQVDGIKFSFYDYGENAIRDLEGGHLDHIAWDMPPSEVQRFANNPVIEPFFMKGSGMASIVYNMGRPSFGYDLPAPGGRDAGKPLRIALAHCVDAAEIRILAQPVAGGSPGIFEEWGNVSVPNYAFDPSEAINILRKAGYRLKADSLPPGEGNWWLNPDGSAIGAGPDGLVELLISIPEEDPLMYKVGVLVAYRMRQIGLNIELVPMETGLLWGRISAGEFDMCIASQGFRTSKFVPFVIEEEESYSNPPKSPSNPVPRNMATEVTVYRPTLSVNVFDPDGDTMTVRFYDATTNAQIGADQVDIPSGGTASVRWPGLNSLTIYTWYATADDTEYVTRSPTWSFITEGGAGGRGSTGDSGSQPFQGTRAVAGDFVVGGEIPGIYLRRPENYYYSSFHSSNIVNGMNFYGYRNSSFDGLIEAAMVQTGNGRDMRALHTALAPLAYDMPFNRLYHPSIYEIYRSDRFGGFIDGGSGTLLNLESMRNVHRQERNVLSARFFMAPMTARANQTFPVKIRVTDMAGGPIGGALVMLESSSGHLSAAIGLTDGLGIFATEFTAPQVLQDQKGGVPVMLNLLSASMEGYRHAPGRQMFIMVYPEGTMQLSVSAQALQDVVMARDSYGTPGFTYIDVQVTDEKNLPVRDASVAIDIAGAPMVLDARTLLTDSDGRLRIRLTASADGAPGDSAIAITASKVAYAGGAILVTVTVMPTAESMAAEQQGSGNWMYIAALATIALACLVHLWWRKSRKGA